MRRHTSVRRASVATTAALALIGGSLAAAPAAAAAPRTTQAVEAPDGGRLNPVTPTRIMDTRESGGPVQAGSDRELVVLDRGGVPESGVSAVVLNVTVTLGSERSDLQVYPVGQRPPQRTSNLNWLRGQTVPVQVQTGVGDGGRVAFSVHSGSAHVVVDVFGWYGDGSGTTDTGSGYTALSPSRLLDTRDQGGPVEAGEPRMVQVTGNAGVPASATAVMMNATMLGTPGNADLQVFPAGQRPERRTSNLNVSRGETRANAVMTPIGDDGRIGLSVSEATGHVVLDVVGYYGPQSTGRFISVSPTRILDTRPDRSPVQAGNPRTPTVANRGGVPLNADAAVLNVTATAASDPLDLQVYPVGDRPERRTSTLNLREGMAVPNLAVTTLGTGGQIGLSPAQGTVHVILDVFGYFTGATWSTCTNPRDRWTAQFPGDWRMNPASVVEPCSLFDPKPFALPGAPQEIPLGIAVQLRRAAITIDNARSDDASRQISETPGTVDGQTAYRQEREQTQSTTIPEGTRYTLWLVDLEGETLIATAYDVGDPAYSTKVQVLDEMMSRLDLHDDATQPSAVGIAAVDANGRAVVLDGRSGEVRRVLVEGIDVDDPASNAIAVSPDRETVYVVRPGSTHSDAQIVRVDAAGGSPETLTQGHSPAISPDGTTLAYVRFEDTAGPGHPDPTIRLRTLSTGQERRIGGGDVYGIWDLAWTGDGTRIAFTAGEVKTGVHVLARSATSLTEAKRLGPESTDASWDEIATLGDDRLAVIERCCNLPAENPERWRVLEVDATTGAVGGEVFGRDRTEAVLVDDRRDARGMIVVQRGGPGGSPLLRWDGSGELRQIADDVIVAAW